MNVSSQAYFTQTSLCQKPTKLFCGFYLFPHTLRYEMSGNRKREKKRTILEANVQNVEINCFSFERKRLFQRVFLCALSWLLKGLVYLGFTSGSVLEYKPLHTKNLVLYTLLNPLVCPWFVITVFKLLTFLICCQETKISQI